MTKPKPAGSARPTVQLTFPQRRILGAILDLIDKGTPAVTTSDVYTRLASQASAAPIAEATIRSHLDALTPELVTKVRPQIEVTEAAWRSMNRNPAMAPSRKPSTPIEEAVTAQPVPIVPVVVAPALREKPATPVRKPSAPLSLETRGPVRPKIEVVQRFEVGDPEAFKRAVETAVAATGAPDTTDAPPELVPLLVVPPLDKPTVTFPRYDRETMVDLAIRYLQARGAEGSTAAEAQSDTDVDLGTAFCDITRRGRAVGVGNGSKHNGKHVTGDPPRRRWYAVEFAPEGVEPVVAKAKAAPVVAYDGASSLVVSPEFVDPATAYGQRIAELERQYAELRMRHDKVTDELASIAAALGFTGEVRKLLDFAGEVTKERDEARKRAADADEAMISAVERAERAEKNKVAADLAWVNATNATRDILGAVDNRSLEVAAKRLRSVLAPAEGQTLEDRARQLNTQIAATWFALGVGKEGQTIDERAADWVKLAQEDQERAVKRTRADEHLECAGALANAIDVRPDTPFDRSIGCVVDIYRAVDHALHVLASNLPRNAPSAEGGDETTGPLPTADKLVAMVNAAANALASIPEPNPAAERADVADALAQAGDDLVADVRRSVVGDLARALNVRVEHTDPSEAYFWLLDVARKRVPLDVGISDLMNNELDKHRERMRALSTAHALAKAAP